MRNYLLFFIFFFVCISLASQHSMAFGLKYMLGVNSISTSQADASLKQSISQNGSIFIDHRITEAFSIVPAISYMKKGFKTTENNSSLSLTEIYANYISLDFQAKLRANHHNLAWHIQMGPSVGFMISNNLEKMEWIQMLNMHQNLYSLKFGTGITWSKNRFDFFAELVADYALKDITRPLAQRNFTLNQYGLSVGFMYYIQNRL